MTVIEGYIPDRFNTFMGFPRRLPIEIIEAAKKKERKAQLMRWRSAFQHKSHGWKDFRKQIENEILKGVNQDWRYNGDDEYPFDEFDHKVATRKVFDLLRKKGLLKYIR